MDAIMTPSNSKVERTAESETYPLEMSFLPEKFVQKAELELNENPKSREQGIEKLRELIKGESNMAGIRFSDDDLIFYLRCRKYNVERSFAMLKNFVAFCRQYKNFFKPINSSSYENLMKFFSFLPIRDKDGCAILNLKIDAWDPKIAPFDDFVRYHILLLSFFASDPMTQVNGMKAMYNVKCNPIKYLRFCTPSFMSLIYHGMFECFPVKLKAFHAIYPSFLFKTVWMFISIFMSEKMKKRFVLHSDTSTLRNYFSDDLIPVEYGGKLEGYDFEPFARKAKLPDTVKYILEPEYGA